MTCPGCGHANPAGARFCGGCGARLEIICASCQASNPPGNRFCHECGGALHGEAAAGRFASPQAAPTRSRKYESWAIGQPRQTWMSQLALGRLDAAQGRREDALAAYRAAWSIIAGLRGRTHDAGLRAGLESSPLIRELQDLARPE